MCVVGVLELAALVCLLATNASASALTKSARKAFISEINQQSAAGQTLNKADQILVHECMAKAGFEYYVLPTPPSTTATTASKAESMPYRLTYGWGLFTEFLAETSTPTKPNPTGSLGQKTTTTPENVYIASLSTSQQAAFNVALEGSSGTDKKYQIVGEGPVTGPTQGCLGEAEKELYGSVTAGEESPGISAVGVELRRNALKSPTMAKAISAYKSCMKRAGITATTPNKAESSMAALYAKQGPTAQLHQQEIATAVADLKCQDKVHYQSTLTAAETQAVSTLGSHTVGEVERLMQAQTKAIAKAKKLIATTVSAS
jgi:hypothetical protein